MQHVKEKINIGIIIPFGGTGACHWDPEAISLYQTIISCNFSTNC